jgi:two-component system cell cycle sensor histidine kinase/response regulator CckA
MSKRHGPHNHDKSPVLRRRAEEVLRKRVGDVGPEALSVEEARRLVHELQVHQIELEMQNEELRNAQVMLEEGRRKYSDLFDFSPVGYFIFNEEGVILEANLTGAALLGVERARLIRKPFTVYVARDSQDAFYLHRGKVMESKERQTCELKLQRRDGTEFYAELESVSTARKTIRAALLDITGRKKAERDLENYRKNLEHMVEERASELLKANRKLVDEIVRRKKMEDEILRAQKLEAVGILAGGIAHDFNNVLTSVLNNIYVSKALLGDNGKALERLAAAERALQGAVSLTRQLLTFSRGGEPVRKTAYVRNLIRDTASFSLRGSKVKCDFSAAADLWPVMADEGQLAQVIGNLVINADQAMPRGGTVVVRADNVTLDADSRLPLPAGRYVRVSVRDHGDGIQEENLQKIFDPYFTTKQKGSGLGLSSSYSIIRKHGGLITVESEAGAGSTFDIYLPASAEDVLEAEEDALMPEAGGARVLLMDDDEMVAESAAEGLRSFGYEVETATDGGAACLMYEKAMVSGRPFEAVVIDLTVQGGMGGAETIKRLKKLDPDVRAIVASGYSDDPVMSRHADYGFRTVITKPYMLEELVRALQRLIKR